MLERLRQIFTPSAPRAAPPARADLESPAMMEAVTRVRDRLRAAHQANREHYAAANRIWRETLDVLRYALTLEPPDILRLRLHCGLFTGDAPWHFWHVADHYDAAAYAKQYGYEDLIRGVPPELWVSEPLNPLIPRPMGVAYRGMVVNPNVIRFQSVVTNLHLTGLWERTFGAGATGSGPAVVVEIGPGYGGLAEILLRHAARPVHFVAVDFPEILLFCAGQVLASQPAVPVVVVQSPGEWAAVPADRSALVLVPAFATEALAALPRADLALNIASFQEMRTPDIERHLDLLLPKLAGVLYSDNINRHLANPESPVPLAELFARRGQLYPAKNFYDELIRANKWDWFYSTFLLGSPGALDGLARRLRLFHGGFKLGPVRELNGETFGAVK